MSGRAPRVHWISAEDPVESFPPIDQALPEPDGLLAAGGDLSAERLLYAYRHGVFPWYSEGQPILWWSPSPRCIILPDQLHLSRRSLRMLNTSDYTISFNRAFEQVIDACAAPRTGQDGTWITSAMRSAYCDLHRQGWAVSCETWLGDQLIGGIYGLAIGKAFFGESMFSRRTNASKAAIFVLCQELAQRRYSVLDCQVVSPHLLALGAQRVDRPAFKLLLDAACVAETQLELASGQPRRIVEFMRP